MSQPILVARRGVLSAIAAVAGSQMVACDKPRAQRAGLASFPKHLDEPKPNPRQYGFPDTSGFLGNIYGPGPAGTSPGQQYGTYFNLQTFRWKDYIDSAGVHKRDGFASAAGAALGAAGSKNLVSNRPSNPPLFPWKQVNDPQQCVINLQVMDTLAGANAFLGTNPNGDGNQLKRVFVQVDSLSVVLPYDVAMLLSACFIKGFVTRYLLGQYVPTWKVAIPAHPSLPIRFDDLPQPAGANPITPQAAVDSWITTSASALAATFAAAATWGGTYNDAILANTNAAIQMLGIMAGWRAVDNLTTLATGGNTDATAAQQQIWKLIGVQYNTHRIGAMVGYTLMTLTGFLECDQTAAVITAGPQGPLPSPGPTDAAALVGRLGTYLISARNKTSDPIRGLIEQIQRLITGELYNIVVNSQWSGAMAPPDAAAEQSGFISGFAKGTTQAADILFAEFYREGFYAGYSQGYELGDQVGYSAGLADGYSQGYAAGYQVGYSDAPSASGFLNGLQTIVGGLGSALGTGLSDILNSTGTAGTVIAAVASLF
jgi:hypothetical protein